MEMRVYNMRGDAHSTLSEISNCQKCVARNSCVLLGMQKLCVFYQTIIKKVIAQRAKNLKDQMQLRIMVCIND